MSLDFLAGCIGGMAGVLVGHPLDTVKTLLQTQDPINPKYRGTVDCVRSLVAKESVRGLYRGVSSPLVGLAGINAIVFGVYGNVQRRMDNPYSVKSQAIAGATAGLTQCIITSPMELIKCRMQVAQKAPQSSWSFLKNIYTNEGIKGVYRGLGLTAAREVPAFTAYFVSYELLTKTDNDEPVPTSRMLCAGGLAGVISWSICYPVDVIKTRMQISESCYTSSLDCLKKTLASGGHSSLFRGLTPTVMRAFPVNAVTFTLVTWSIRLFDSINPEGVMRKSEKMLEKYVEAVCTTPVANF